MLIYYVALATAGEVLFVLVCVCDFVCCQDYGKTAAGVIVELS